MCHSALAIASLQIYLQPVPLRLTFTVNSLAITLTVAEWCCNVAILKQRNVDRQSYLVQTLEVIKIRNLETARRRLFKTAGALNSCHSVRWPPSKVSAQRTGPRARTLGATTSGFTTTSRTYHVQRALSLFALIAIGVRYTLPSLVPASLSWQLLCRFFCIAIGREVPSF